MISEGIICVASVAIGRSYPPFYWSGDCCCELWKIVANVLRSEIFMVSPRCTSAQIIIKITTISTSHNFVSPQLANGNRHSHFESKKDRHLSDDKCPILEHIATRTRRTHLLLPRLAPIPQRGASLSSMETHRCRLALSRERAKYAKNNTRVLLFTIHGN